MIRPIKTTLAQTLVLITAGLATTAPALAAPGEEAGCPNVNPELAISVGANASEFRKEAAQVILQGDVTIDQGVLHLAADEVTIEYMQGETRDIGSQGRVNSLRAVGTVKIVCENDRAHGGEALYNVAGRTIKLTKNVMLVRGDNILKGETLFINLDTGHMTIEGGGMSAADDAQPGGDTRIKAVFTPAPPQEEPQLSPGSPPEPSMESSPEPSMGTAPEPDTESVAEPVDQTPAVEAPQE